MVNCYFIFVVIYIYSVTPLMDAISLFIELLNMQQLALSTLIIVLISLFVSFEHTSDKASQKDSVQGAIER